MSGVFKKCLTFIMSMIFFIFMTIFIQTPVVATFNNERINLSPGIDGDFLRVIICIVFIMLCLYLLSLLARCFGVDLSIDQFKEKEIAYKPLVIYVSVTLLVTLLYLMLLFIGNGYNVGFVPDQISEMSYQPVKFILFLLRL
ncbi:hypothetical protein ACVRY7_10825 [Streptococcus ictaluri]|uniref:Uncharacterized protein n=1 Tax=Streptococcus ictaluri 707-05 TaxID=764299 RepID=G5K1T4_9STRE|nr:hypothetical protein [Streptococcus ictaluri]EHI70285.1 hypothetical protein STRIC_2342 [Streptococcus ictaluri 707-05]